MAKKQRAKYKILEQTKDRSNLIALSQKDIDGVIDLGTALSLKPKKNVKGVIILFKGTKKLTLDKLCSIAERITKPLPKEAKILWSIKICEKTKKNTVKTLYVG